MGHRSGNVDNAAFGASAPGIGLEAAQWLVEREVVLVGSDTWATEVVPNPNPELAFPVHQLLIPRNGIYIFENLLTEELARDRVYEFAFFFAPLKLKGGTGRPPIRSRSAEASAPRSDRDFAVGEGFLPAVDAHLRA